MIKGRHAINSQSYEQMIIDVGTTCTKSPQLAKKLIDIDDTM